ncbi:MAG TPA: ISKra4 family transposase [Acidimicrobiales bacterium]|nr:ISKra4 family transposase [Acidimicrobiales bacterium]
MEAYALESPHPAFDGSWELFGAVVSFLDGPQAAELSHADLEDRLEVDVRKVICRLYQDHLEVRAQRERRLSAVVDADGVVRERAEVGRERGLATVFGEVRVRRVAYRQAGHGDLHPADAGLNLPAEKHSHGLRRLAAVESVRGSFADAADAIERTTGQRLGKRQVEQLTGRAAADFDAFYASRRRHLSPAGAVLALTFDGKGVVMRPDGLRPATAKAAGRSRHKLATRLSKGEKRNRKRMAEVGAVYDVVPVPRTAEDILSDPGTDRPRTAGPKATNKWRTASVVADAATVIAEGFDEADRRDPHHTRTWVALVDGNAHQIDRIRAEADARGVAVTIVADFVHVIEYVWRAAWCFYPEGDPAAEVWVREQGLRILDGRSGAAAAAIRRKATYAGLTPTQRGAADTAADYLTRLRPHLGYATALAHGWPIATGVIEGACRHLVKDRMDITGARWSLDGAEAILKLRALVSNGDFDQYWAFHLAQEKQRIHTSRYLNGLAPAA